jgi:hypothetical protein
MLQNINLLNTVRNNVGLALDVAQVAAHRTNLLTTHVAMRDEVGRVSVRTVSGKRPCDEASSSVASGRDRATLRADADDARLGRDIAFASFAASAADVAGAAAAAASTEAECASTEASGTKAAATTRAYSQRLKPQQASMPAKQPGSKLPAAIWASLVLSRV